MKFLRSCISLFKKSQLNAGISVVHRRFCDKKTENSNSNIKIIREPKVKQNVEQIVDTAYDIESHSAVRNHFENGIAISSYSTHGFRLNQQVQVIGPIILFPRTVFSWNIESVEEITVDSLMIFGVIQPKVDTLLIGTGEDETTAKVSKNLLELAHRYKINVEILSTQLACTQYNYMTGEGRMVAAALFPPRALPEGEDDPFTSMNFDNKMFSLDTFHSPGINDGFNDIKLK